MENPNCTDKRKNILLACMLRNFFLNRKDAVREQEEQMYNIDHQIRKEVKKKAGKCSHGRD